MAIKLRAQILLLLVTGAACNKPETSCPRFGYEYVYSNPTISYSPGSDSIPLGSSIILEAAAPKSFFDIGVNSSVTLDQPDISGPLRVSRYRTDPFSSFFGAVNEVEFFAITGRVEKPTGHYSDSSLVNFRTVFWERNNTDSFRIKIKITPTVRGVFGLNLGQQGNRDKDCALYKYFLPIQNQDQHLHYLLSLTGYVGDYARNYAYYFKVY